MVERWRRFAPKDMRPGSLQIATYGSLAIIGNQLLCKVENKESVTCSPKLLQS